MFSTYTFLSAKNINLSSSGIIPLHSGLLQSYYVLVKLPPNPLKLFSGYVNLYPEFKRSCSECIRSYSEPEQSYSECLQSHSVSVRSCSECTKSYPGLILSKNRGQALKKRLNINNPKGGKKWQGKQSYRSRNPQFSKHPKHL